MLNTMKITSVVVSLCLIFLYEGVEAQDMWEEISVPGDINQIEAGVECSGANYSKQVPSKLQNDIMM